jgi:hypothetical protein
MEHGPCIKDLVNPEKIIESWDKPCNMPHVQKQ